MLYEAFFKRFGYDLRGRLFELWEGDGQVRLDFAELLESRLEWLETEFKRRLPGRFVGIHRTMHEELADDFRIGCSDYFRHKRGTSAGFTDSIFEREDSMVTMGLLARALGRVSNSGEAWNNSWGFRPTRDHLEYYLRLLGCLGVRWLGHAYHSSVAFGPSYPHHPTWREKPAHLSVHRKLLEQLEGAEPDCDTAVIYNWQSVADFTGASLHEHRRTFLFACLELVLAQVPVTIADPLQLAGSRFRRILVPWPNRLMPEAWDALEKAAAEGSEIFFMGPPAWQDSPGRDLTDRWTRLTGTRVPPREKAMLIPYGDFVEVKGRPFLLDPATAVPNWQWNPAYTYSDHLKAWVLEGGEPAVSWKGQPIGVRCGRVTTVATELTHAPGALVALWPFPSVALPGLLTFPYRRGDERLLAFCARHAWPVRGEFVWEGARVVCDDIRHGILRRDGKGTVTVWME